MLRSFQSLLSLSSLELLLGAVCLSSGRIESLAVFEEESLTLLALGSLMWTLFSITVMFPLLNAEQNVRLIEFHYINIAMRVVWSHAAGAVFWFAIGLVRAETNLFASKFPLLNQLFLLSHRKKMRPLHRQSWIDGIIINNKRLLILLRW